jgi:hypothetical protein
MRIRKSENDIRSLEDWLIYAPPKMGVRHWKDGLRVTMAELFRGIR